MVGKVQRIKIDKLINWFDNPRHDVGKNEIDTLEKLFNAVGTQYMLNLASDIQENGLLGNQHIVVVYSEKLDKYVVYEGNRRVAALKLLLHTSHFKFLGRETIKKVKEISQKATIRDELDCYVTNEEDAFFIMERIHSGEDRGRGIKKWGAREKENFQVRKNNVKKLSYLIDEYVRRYNEGLEITSILPFTTIQRIFNNREVKNQIGLDVENESTFTPERMEIVVEASKWIVRDAEMSGMSVTRLYNKARNIEDRIIPWLKEYRKEGDFSKNKNIKVQLIDKKIEQNVKGLNQNQVNKDKIEEKDGDKFHNLKDSNEQKNNMVNIIKKGGKENLPYFFQGLNYANLNPKDVDSHGVAAICREIQLFSDKKLVSTYPIAASFLVRGLIEQSIKYYSKKNYIQGQNKLIWENIKNIDKLSKIIKNYNKNLHNYIQDINARQYFDTLFGRYEDNIDPLNWVIHRPGEYQISANELIELPRKGLLHLINYMLL